MGFHSCGYSAKKLAEHLGIELEAAFEALDASRVGGFAKVWKVSEDEPRVLFTREDGTDFKVTTANISIGKKQESGDYKNDFQDGFVQFIGRAADKILELADEIPESGLWIQITNCDAKNPYDHKKHKTYYNWIISDFVIPEDDEKGKSTKKSTAKKTTKSAAKSTKTTKAKTKKAEPVEDDDDDDLPF